jgi:DNA primase catalytic core
VRRIPPEEIDRLKASVPLAGLCEKYGFELKPVGQDLHGRCPWHEDGTPSFSVTPSKNLWNCLGGCGGGSNFDLVMRCEKVSFTRAYEILKAAEGGAAPAPAYRSRNGTRSHPVLVDPEVAHADAALLGTVTDFYHQTFLNHPQAMQYLQQRKCFHPEAVTKFRLGYANRTLGYRLPGTIEAGKKLKAQLQKIGILRESGHEHLSGCVVVPVWDEQGNVGELYGRRITKPIREANDHLYLPGPHGGVWNAPELQRSRTWLLCEAALDALTLWCAGFPNVTWTYGVNGFSPDHWRLVRTVRPDRVVVCFDNDEAGNKAANELAQKLEAEGIEVWRAEPPPQSDINDVARKAKDTKAELSNLLAAAQRMLPQGGGNVPMAPLDPRSDASPPVAAPLGAEPSMSNGVAVPTEAAKVENAPGRENEALSFVLTPDGREATLQAQERLWRVRGLEVNSSFDALKVNLRMQYRNKFHLHTFDLYNARHRAEFISQAVEVTGADKADLESDLAVLINRLEEHHQARLVQKLAVAAQPNLAALSPQEEAEALAVLKNPRLLDVIIQDLHRCGLVGEDTNLAVAWLVSLSRKLEKPLGVCVMSRSAAGKSTLLEATARLVPDEDKHQYTALTPQALFHMPEDELKHKALFIAEDVGAEGASYSLKTIQSDGELVIACTMKDENSGQMVTKTKIVHGPVALFLTSTSRSVDDELLNRLLVLTIDESAEQTDRIHAAQRHEQTLQGIIERRARPRLRRLHQNIQRLIRPLMVQNPFEADLNYQSKTLRSRRDHRKYLDLINVITLAHQYQRPVKSAQDIDGQPFQYIEVTRSDMARADALLREVLPQTTDELWPASRKMLQTLQHWAAELPLSNGQHHTWSRREVRERTGWSDTQVRMVLAQLVEFEYLIQIGQGQGRRLFYRLAETAHSDGIAVSGKSGSATSHFAATSQSPQSEVPSSASSLVAAAKKEETPTSQTLRGEQKAA